MLLVSLCLTIRDVHRPICPGTSAKCKAVSRKNGVKGHAAWKPIISSSQYGGGQTLNYQRLVSPIGCKLFLKGNTNHTVCTKDLDSNSKDPVQSVSNLSSSLQ